MSLENTRQVFERLGKDDPLWAVLSHPDKEGGKWQLDEFLATGRREIESKMAYLDEMSIDVRRGDALDFGCGVGRLTQALAEYFQTTTGVDIAESMVEYARQLNPHGERCRFVVNTAPDLACFDDASFDFVYSNIVLQHMPPDNALVYIREFMRVLRPQGIALFNVPDHRVVTYAPGSLAYRISMWRYEQFRPWWKKLRGKELIPMNGIPRLTIEQLLAETGGELLDVDEYNPLTSTRSTKKRGWVKYGYCVRKS